MVFFVLFYSNKVITYNLGKPRLFLYKNKIKEDTVLWVILENQKTTLMK